MPSPSALPQPLLGVPPPPCDAAPETILSAFATQQDTALRWRASTAVERSARIKRLRAVMPARRDAFHDAFAQDLRQSAAEVEASELLPVMEKSAMYWAN